MDHLEDFKTKLSFGSLILAAVSPLSIFGHIDYLIGFAIVASLMLPLFLIVAFMLTLLIYIVLRKQDIDPERKRYALYKPVILAIVSGIGLIVNFLMALRIYEPSIDIYIMMGIVIYCICFNIVNSISLFRSIVKVSFRE